MYKPEECKFCKETEFEFHEEKEIYNIDTDEEEMVKEVHECSVCGAFYYEEGEYLCAQIGKSLDTEDFTPKLDNYVKS